MSQKTVLRQLHCGYYFELNSLCSLFVSSDPCFSRFVIHQVAETGVSAREAAPSRVSPIVGRLLMEIYGGVPESEAKKRCFL